MPAADHHTVSGGGDQCAGDPKVHFSTEFAIGVEKPECETDDRRDRPECDVALVPVEPNTQNVFLTLVLASTDDAAIRDGGGIAARGGTGQRETGNLLPSRQAREVMLLLLVGAVVQQKLGGAQ